MQGSSHILQLGGCGSSGGSSYDTTGNTYGDSDTYVIPGGNGYSVVCNDGSISNSGASKAHAHGTEA